MKIIITGGAGMIGVHCAEYFASRGHTVLACDNLLRSTIFGSEKESVEHNWQYLTKVDGVERTIVDIRDWKTVHKLFTHFEPDTVIHAAAQPGVKHSLENPVEDFGINAVGTLNVLEAFRQTNAEGVFIYLSTNKVYGNNVGRHTLCEKESRYGFLEVSGIDEFESIDLTGHTPYGISKLVGDLYVQDYSYTYGLRTGVFRMSCIYGTRQFGFEDQGWIAWFCRCFLTGQPITLFGDGKQVRDVLWVDDLVDAFDKFIHSDLRQEVFNIGGGLSKSLSLLELIGLLEDITDLKVDIRHKDWRKFDQKVYLSDINKVCSKLKWTPNVEPSEGVTRLTRWMQSNIDLFR